MINASVFRPTSSSISRHHRLRHDAPEVFEAIERANPYARQVRRQFFDLAAGLDAALDDRM